MPVVRIDVIKGRPALEKRRLFEEVHGALVEVFGIPEEDRTHRLIEHDPENFEIPPGHSENYTGICDLNLDPRLFRAGAKFENGVFVERPDESASGDTHAHDALIHRP